MYVAILFQSAELVFFSLIFFFLLMLLQNVRLTELHFPELVSIGDELAVV